MEKDLKNNDQELNQEQNQEDKPNYGDIIRSKIRADIKKICDEEYQNVLQDFFKNQSEKVDFSKNDIINKNEKPNKSIRDLLIEENEKEVN